MASDCVTQNKLLAHMNKIMKHTPICLAGIMFLHVVLYIVSFKMEDDTLAQIDFECFAIVICNNTAA